MRPKLPKLQVEVGCFYRDRQGNKWICYREKEGTELLYCMNVRSEVQGVFSPNGNGFRQGMDDGPVELVEEVRADAPIFVDPTVEPTDRDYDAMWERVEVLPCGIEISKFSPKTSPGDVKAPDMPSEIRRKLDRTTIGKLWRCRLNKHTRWRYAWGIDKAVALALSYDVDASE